MKALFTFTCLVTASLFSNHCQAGVLMFDSVVGEIDPYEIGDACVLYGIEFDENGRSPGKVIAFVTHEDACTENAPMIAQKSCYKNLKISALNSEVSGPQLEVLQALSPKPARAFIISQKTGLQLNCN